LLLRREQVDTRESNSTEWALRSGDSGERLLAAGACAIDCPVESDLMALFLGLQAP